MFKSFLLAVVLTASASSLAKAVTCADGENQMSVEGVEGVYCVLGDPCIATFSTGACPGVQEGLPFGSYCGIVASGVYGCKTYFSAQTIAPTPQVTTEAPQPITDVPVTAEPPVSEIPYTDCGTEATRVSVQGLQGSFCADEPVCVQQISTGNCPGPQDGLQFGSFCDWLNTGAYGCKPYIADNVRSNVTYDAPLDCSNNPAGNIPVSIVAGERAFCAPEPVCSGTIVGNCPKVQDGLAQDSECMLIETGVYGCVFLAST